MSLGFMEQADDRYKKTGSGIKSHRWLKRSKLRKERREARINPEKAPEYGKYKGYQL